VAGFTKLFASIIHSTVWREDMHVKVVWVTMLAMADRNGRVFSSLPGLADASRVSLEQCTDALSRLSSPDEYSRTKTNEGRRIKDIDGGWELYNYLKYREARDADERRIQTREAVSRHRARKADVSHGKPRKPKKAEAEAEAEAEANNGNGLAPAAQPPGEPWSREASDDWIEAKGGQPPGRIFPALKRAVGSFGWERVRPAWRFYLATTGSEFVVVDKFVSAFGEWEKRANGAAPPGAKVTPGNATLAAAARVLERHGGRG
jgi:hypothetical protein